MIRPNQAPLATAAPSQRRSQDVRAAAMQPPIADAVLPLPQSSVPAKAAFSDDDVPRSVSHAVERADSVTQKTNTPAAAFEAAINRAPPASIASSPSVTSPPAEFQGSNRYSSIPSQTGPLVTTAPTSTFRKGNQYVNAGAFKGASRVSQPLSVSSAAVAESASFMPSGSSGPVPDSARQTEQSEPDQRVESPTHPKQEEDPLLAALRDLRDPSKVPSRPPPTGGIGLPGMTQGSVVDYAPRRTATTHRYSQDQPDPVYSRSPVTREASPSPIAAMMQPPAPGADPTSNVVHEYGQMFPGERRASISRRNSTASQASDRPNMGSMGRSGGFAGVGANGRSTSPQPFNPQNRSTSPYSQPQRTASPYELEASQRTHSPNSQQGAPLRSQSPYGQQTQPQRAQSPYHHNSPSRTTSPYGAKPTKQPPRTSTPLGIALDASGQVTHDQLAVEYQASVQRQQQQAQAQQVHVFAQPPANQMFQQAPYPYQHQAYQQQTQPLSVVSPPPAQQQQQQQPQSIYGQAGWQAVSVSSLHISRER
jgi:hypothetical protein